MKPLLWLLLATTALWVGCGKKNSGGDNLATAPVDYIATVAQAGHDAEKKIDVTSINRAIQEFQVQEGRYPKDLQELVPNYIAKIPEGPVGTKIVYDPNTGTVKIEQQPATSP